MTTRMKYPRTMHMHYSPGVQSDDKVIQSVERFVGKRVILTEKMDGENTTLYNDGFHARSLDSAHHPSRNWIARIQGEVGYLIPENHRICGENVYARHSIEYTELENYFYMFSYWRNHVCYNWDDTVKESKHYGLPLVNVLFDGIYDDREIRNICESLDHSKVEGAVLRIADSFDYDEFDKCVMKYVRKGHVQTDDHWMHSQIVPNRLK